MICPEPGVQGLVAVAGRARPHHPGAAEHRGDAGDDQRVDVEQRQPAQHPLPGRQPAALGDAAGAGELVGVGVRGDLRGAGGPPGVHERGEIVRRRAGPRRPGGRTAARRSPRPGRPRPARGRPGSAVGGASPARAGGAPCAPSGRSARTAVMPAWRATSSSRCHSCGSSSGPAATRTRDPVRRISSAIRSPDERGVDRGGDPGGLRGQRGGVQHRGVDAGQRHRVAAPHPQGGQRVGDPGHRARQLGVGPGQAAGVIGRVRDPLGGDAVGPGAGGVQQQLVGRLRQRQYFFCVVMASSR